MAYTTHETNSVGVVAAVQSFFGGVFRALSDMAENNERFRKMQTLQAMSDKELAARGIKREDIARVVFHDVLYL